MALNSGGRRRLQRPDRSSTPEFRASGNAVLAGTAGRDDRASCVVRRYDHYRAVRIFTLRHHYPPNPMMRRSRIDLGENHDPGRGATDRSTGPLRRCRGKRSGRPTSRSAPRSPPSMTLRAGCAGGLRPSLTAVPRGAGGISVGTKKRPAVKKRKLMRLDFDPAIRERMITPCIIREIPELVAAKCCLTVGLSKSFPSASP